MTTPEFFCFDGTHAHLFETEDEATKAAEGLIDSMHESDGWTEQVDHILVGKLVVTHIVKDENRREHHPRCDRNTGICRPSCDVNPLWDADVDKALVTA